ncbi:MAG: hypothetical protein KDA24_05880 [Deltaproteobacteria bacterium]|nr:hypothetical protein [Deltaproteobacteria bacterium]
MPIVRTAARTALGARQVVKDLGRLQEIAQILAGHGFGWVVANIEVPGVGLLRRFTGEEGRTETTPARVTNVIKALGPTFVKLGQVLSTRSDLIPREYALALQELQDQAGPVPYEDIEAAIEAALGGKPDDIFASFDREPLAAASIAQVHRAQMKTGEEVVLKVQRPNVRQRIETDMSILGFLARQAEAQAPEVKAANLSGILKELNKTIARSTDFRYEADNIHLFARNFEGNPDVVIPKVFEPFSKATVITMDFLDGVRLSDAREAGCDMALVGQRFLGSAFQMLLHDGVFHADLHHGNAMVLPGNRLGLIDFGEIGRLTDEMRENITTLFFAINRRDFRTIARILWEIAVRPGHVDYSGWEADVQEVVEEELAGKAMGNIAVDQLIGRLMEGAMRHGVQVPASYTVYFKALITAQGVAHELIPEVDPLEEMMPYVQEMARRLYSRERLQEELFYYITSFRYSAKRLPLVLSQLLQDVQDGRLRMRSIIETSDQERAERERQINRLVQAVLVCGLLIASSLGLHATGVPMLLGMPAPATVGYLLAFGLGGLVSWRVFRSG